MKINWPPALCLLVLSICLGLLGFVPNQQLRDHVPWIVALGDKSLHALAFAALTANLHWLAWQWRRRSYRWAVVTAGVISASIASELLQGAFGTRTAEWQDVPYNWLGIAIASACVFGVERWLQYRLDRLYQQVRDNHEFELEQCTTAVSSPPV